MQQKIFYLFRLHTCFFQNLLDCPWHGLDCKLINRLSVHLRILCRKPVMYKRIVERSVFTDKCAAPCTVRALHNTHYTCFFSFYDGSAGTVAKQNASASIVPVHHLRKGFRPYYQRRLRHACFHVCLRNRKPEQKSGTCRIDVKGCRIRSRNSTLYLTCSGGKAHIARYGSYYNQIQFLCTDACLLHSALCRLHRHRSGTLLYCNIPVLYTRAALYPLIRGIYQFFQFLVAESLLGKCAPCSYNSCRHDLPPQIYVFSF